MHRQIRENLAPFLKCQDPTKIRSSTRSRTSILRTQSTKCRMSSLQMRFSICKTKTIEMVLSSKRASLDKKNLAIEVSIHTIRPKTNRAHRDLQQMIDLSRCLPLHMPRKGNKHIYLTNQSRLKFFQTHSVRKVR